MIARILECRALRAAITDHSVRTWGVLSLRPPWSRREPRGQLSLIHQIRAPGGSVYETRGTESCRRRPPLLRSASCVRTSSECKHRRVGRSSASCDECILESKTTLAGLRDISGRGLVITAAYVVGRVGSANPSVAIAGHKFTAEPVKQGDFDEVDLTLLRIDPSGLPAPIGSGVLPLCEAPPVAGEAVVTV